MCGNFPKCGHIDYVSKNHFHIFSKEMLSYVKKSCFISVLALTSNWNKNKRNRRKNGYCCWKRWKVRIEWEAKKNEIYIKQQYWTKMYEEMHSAHNTSQTKTNEQTTWRPHAVQQDMLLTMNEKHCLSYVCVYDLLSLINNTACREDCITFGIYLVVLFFFCPFVNVRKTLQKIASNQTPDEENIYRE